MSDSKIKEEKVIVERLELGMYGTNCYIVGDETTKEGLIIDPGAEAKRILNRVKDLGLEIKLIVLTHTHMDHTGALAEVKEATGTEIAVHSDDAGALQSRNPFRSPLQSLPFPERLLKGGDSIEVGNLRLLVLHTPGHTPGGICLFGEGAVFSGDTLFNLSIGRTDFPGGSYSQILDSIHTKLMVLPDTTIVYPGHGPETTIGDERRWNSFLRGQ